MTLQYIFVALVVLSCVAYSLWRIAKVVRLMPGDRCRGCSLKDTCSKNRVTARKLGVRCNANKQDINK